MTDIVLGTCDRLPLLRQTLRHILERTATPFRLYAIDDASIEGNADYIDGVGDPRIAVIVRRARRAGIAANLRAVLALTTSDPVVFTDDDVLCPKLDPDWLTRGLAAMARFPELGILALNNPACNVGGQRGLTSPRGDVTFCRNVGGTFAFMRRAVLETCAPPDGFRSPIKVLCAAAAGRGWRVGYLTNIYCRHIGAQSVRRGNNLGRELDLVLPVDDETLEPPDGYKG